LYEAEEIEMRNLISSALGTNVFGVLLLASSSFVVAQPVQWSENEHWYEAVLVGASGIAWTDAQSAAVRRGGYLVTITSPAENDFVFSLVSGDDNFWFRDSLFGNGIGPWIGGFQFDKLAEPDGHWRWTTSEAWSYTNWAISSNPFAAEPNNSDGVEDYAQLFGLRQLKGSTWNDFPNNGYPDRGEFVRGYIVEYNNLPIPEPSCLMFVAAGVAGMFVYGHMKRSFASRWGISLHGST